VSDVDIILPDGAAATVPAKDLDAAIAAGARPFTAKEAVTAQNEAELGGVAGKAATGILGAARAASFGLSDEVLAEGANVVSGEKDREKVLKALSLAKEVNPYSDMAGEAVGLLAGGGGITAAGERLEEAAAARLGEGLLSSVGSMGARGALEGGAIGAQHQITEDYLGDHEFNGQAIFASAAKDALFGGVAGAALGAGAGLLGRARGPAGHAALDEIAGVQGSGRRVLEDARQAEKLMEEMRLGGATSDQATAMADDARVLAAGKVAAEEGAKADRGLASGILDDMTEAAIAKRAGGNRDLQETLQKGYEYNVGKLQEMKLQQSKNALDLKASADRVLRAQTAMDEVSWLDRPERMGKLIDPTLETAQRDMGASLRQEVEKVISLVQSDPTRGGSGIGLTKLKNQLEKSVAMASTPQKLWEGLNQLKQEVGRLSNMKAAPHMRNDFQRLMSSTERVDGQMIPGLYQKLQAALEDETVWGVKAAQAQKAVNQSFSEGFPRGKDFHDRFTINIDSKRGVPVPEADAARIKNGLLGKLGDEAEAQQVTKSTDEWLKWNRDRIAAVREHTEINPAAEKLLREGEEALDEFEKTYRRTGDEARAMARIEDQLAREQGKGVGGLLGLVTDAATKPLTTIQRLAAVRQTVRGVEKGVEKLLANFGQGKTSAAVVEALSPRAKDAVAGEIAEIRKLQGNPSMLEDRLEKMTGSLKGYAPKVAEEIKNTARRAVYWLNKEAPSTAARTAVLGIDSRPQRYSDKQIHDWETKRQAALGAVNGKTAPEHILEGMATGRMNREAIKTIEFVSPKLFARVQELARYELQRQAMDGRLDKMVYQQKAAISVLLHIPADGTWKPSFIDAMQNVKMLPPPEATPAPGAAPPQGAPASGTSKRKIEMNPDVFMTAAAGIEQGGSV
jgi:hypothetical protein